MYSGLCVNMLEPPSALDWLIIILTRNARSFGVCVFLLPRIEARDTSPFLPSAASRPAVPDRAQLPASSARRAVSAAVAPASELLHVPPFSSRSYPRSFHAGILLEVLSEKSCLQASLPSVAV